MNGIGELQQKIMSGVVSVKEITLDILSKIRSDDHNCFITVLDEAVNDAEQMDKRIKDGFKGRLAGVPIAIKDNMRCKGTVTTCGSEILHEVDQVDSAVVRLLKAEGAIIVGKTNMDEFAMGSSNTTSHFGRVLNPLNKTRVPGGSSGGSAAAVALDLCYGALGSDTGGSIRQPASYCGVVGLKPTIGSVDGDGMYALSQDMDQIGPITRSVEDNRLLFEALSGRIAERRNVRGLKIGVVTEQLRKLTPDTAKVIEIAKDVFEANDCELVEVSVPSSSVAYAVYCVLGNAQSAMNLRSIGSKDVDRNLLGKEVKKRIVIGEYVLSHSELIAKANRVRNLLIGQFDEAFTKCDCIISPSAPSVAFKFDDDPSSDKIVFSDIFTQPPSIAGLPALSVPCAFINGLPIGLQLVGAKRSEGLLYSLGELIEQNLLLR